MRGVRGRGRPISRGAFVVDLHLQQPGTERRDDGQQRDGVVVVEARLQGEAPSGAAR